MFTSLYNLCRRGFSAFLWRYDYDVIELLNGLTAIGLGIVLYLSPTDGYALGYGLHSLPFTVTVNFVAFILVLLGVWKVAALRYGTLNHRKWLTFAMIFIWAFIAVLFSEGPFKNIIIFFIGELSLFSVWAFIRLVLKHRIERYIDPRNPYHGN